MGHLKQAILLCGILYSRRQVPDALTQIYFSFDELLEQ